MIILNIRLVILYCKICEVKRRVL